MPTDSLATVERPKPPRIHTGFRLSEEALSALVRMSAVTGATRRALVERAVLDLFARWKDSRKRA